MSQTWKESLQTQLLMLAMDVPNVRKRMSKLRWGLGHNGHYNPDSLLHGTLYTEALPAPLRPHTRLPVLDVSDAREEEQGPPMPEPWSYFFLKLTSVTILPF
jgi:hypothetical protein